MTNNNFTNLDEEEKKKKLKNVLKSRTRGYLTESELETVMQSVKVNRQYAIKLFFKAEEFRRTLTLPKMCGGEIILGSARLGLRGKIGALQDETQPVVAIVRIRTKTLENQIRIFIPENRTKKSGSDAVLPMVLCDGQCMAEKKICEHIKYGRKVLYCDLVAEKEAQCAK